MDFCSWLCRLSLEVCVEVMPPPLLPDRDVVARVPEVELVALAVATTGKVGQDPEHKYAKCAANISYKYTANFKEVQKH